jgi:hypothetical protein
MTPRSMPTTAVPYACSLRVTDSAACLAAIAAGLAGLVAAGRLRHARVAHDHVAITFDAATRDEALRTAREILGELGARRVQVFGALPLPVAC